MNLPVEAIKVATLVAGGAAIALGLRRAPARLRHNVWLVVLAGALLLPLAELAAPMAVVPLSARWQVIAKPTGRWLTIGMAIWLAGIVAALLRMAIGAFDLRRISARAVRFDTPVLRAVCDEARRLAGCRRLPRFLVSPEVRVPATWGVRRPVVVLPSGAEMWSADRLRLVLLHEMMHVRRKDALVERLLSAVAGAYWFHPGVWIAVRQLRYERERACDEAVLATGARASEYCEHLVEIMRDATRQRGAVVIGAAMAVPSTLESRVRAMLTGRPPRHLWFGVPMLAVVVLGIYALAALTPCTERSTAELPRAAHVTAQGG